MTTVAVRLPRGIRNNNPGNIRKTAIAWRGEIEGKDPEFEAFETLEHGVRAMAKTLLTYYRVHKLKTVGWIISRWAPPSENDTLAYIRSVSKALGVEPDETIDLENRETLCKLVSAIVRHENGRKPDGSDWITKDVIEKGVDMALDR